MPRARSSAICSSRSDDCEERRPDNSWWVRLGFPCSPMFESDIVPHPHDKDSIFLEAAGLTMTFHDFITRFALFLLQPQSHGQNWPLDCHKRRNHRHDKAQISVFRLHCDKCQAHRASRSLYADWEPGSVDAANYIGLDRLEDGSLRYLLLSWALSPYRPFPPISPR